MQNQLEKQEKALLVAFHGPKVAAPEAQEHVEELSRLADTLGMEVVKEIVTPLRKIDASTFVTSGKLEELVGERHDVGAEVVIFDDEISPAQQRNLEKAFGCTVMDRTELIIGVFAIHARSKEARLQVELADVRYQLPRLKRLWTHLSRQAGGGSGGMFLKGEGEKQIEIDRRLLNSRIDRLRDQLKEVEQYRKTQRSLREKQGVPVLAIVGYTNAGKSTLLNALTDAEVLAEDKLFATLDTTTRKYSLPSGQDVLLTDTVGLIRKLPHQLVAAFRSTLEEVLYADILLHVVDTSHPCAIQHVRVTKELLDELGCKDKPQICVLNKIDACPNPQMIQRLRFETPHCIPVSALTHEGFEELLEAIVAELSKGRAVVSLRVPQSEYHVISEIQREGNIIEQEYEGNDIVLKADLPESLRSRLDTYAIKE